MNPIQIKSRLNRVGQLMLLCLALAALSSAQVEAEDNEAELLSLLDKFMEGASANSATMHDRFWADDLIYTSSSGDRFGKAEIMAGLEDADPGEESQAKYWAEDQQVKLLGDSAIVAFRLMAEIPAGDGQQAPESLQYFNTGTFVLRDGVWKAIAWQATKIPEEIE